MKSSHQPCDTVFLNPGSKSELPPELLKNVSRSRPHLAEMLRQLVWYETLGTGSFRSSLRKSDVHYGREPLDEINLLTECSRLVDGLR